MQKTLLFSVNDKLYMNRPVGIYRIAHVLREMELDVEVIESANHWTIDQLKELWRSRYNNNIKFIGFGHVFSNWSPVLEEFCAWIKKCHPDIKIIFGSATFVYFPSQYIDYYVRGFGEHAMVALAKWISGNGSRPRFMVPGPQGRRYIDAIHSYPAFPMRSLMVKYQDRDFVEPHEFLAIEFSRGCKFECGFCNFPILGVKEDYTRDADDFELQVRDAYDRFGVTNYLSSDETFNDRTEKITKFADVVERFEFDTFFTGFLRGDLLVSRPRDREELLRMNFLGHFYGIETFHKKAGQAIGKGMDGQRLKDGLLEVKKYFTTNGTRRYRGEIAIIVGLPHEPIESVLSTKQWLIDNWQDQAFLISALSIPFGDHDKMSKISQNYSKYGYREMSPENLGSAEKIKSAHWFEKTLIWENDHMNVFQAMEIEDEWLKLKSTLNFMPGAYVLGNRLDRPYTLDDILLKTYHEFQTMKYNLDNLQVYINKKLSL